MGRRLPAAVLAAALVVTGCTGTEQDTGADGQEATSSPSPTPTVTQEDIEEIEQTVRDFFDAVRMENYDRRRELSTGDLYELADWYEFWAQEDPNPPAPTEMTISRLAVSDVQGDEATVDLRARIDVASAEPYTARLSGPVLLQREDGRWKVVDYQRNGRSVQENIVTSIRGGRVEKNGVLFRVIGLDLRDDLTVALVEVDNRTDGEVNTWALPRIVDERGQQHEAELWSLDSIAPRAKAKGLIFWEASLPVDTERFRLLADLSLNDFQDDVSFDMNLRLIE